MRREALGGEERRQENKGGDLGEYGRRTAIIPSRFRFSVFNCWRTFSSDYARVSR
jgi:hypothetical protein